MSKSWASGSGRGWRQLRATVLARDNYTCQIRTPGICTTTATHAAHIHPRARGGQDVLTNLRASCAPCNLAEGDDLLNPPPRPVTNW